MFVNKLFTYLSRAYLKFEIFNILFSYDDDDIGRFPNLHYCAFN